VESEIEPQRSRRKHSPEFKAEVIQACRQPGVSIRSVALTRGLNPSLVRHWLGSRGTGGVLNGAQAALQPAAQTPSGFLAVQLENRQTATPIRLEIRRDAATVIVDWPAQEVAACGAWLREWLR
jgi:transposase